MTKSICSFFNKSETSGLPSPTLLIFSHAKPANSRLFWVPPVATKAKPRPTSLLPNSGNSLLSISLTLKKARPPLMGKESPAAKTAFAKALPKVSPVPITSPVDFISGPKIGSTPGNLLKGKTASFTCIFLGIISLAIPCSARERPAIHLAAIFANEYPIHLETNGTVLDALGFTSIK